MSNPFFRDAPEAEALLNQGANSQQHIPFDSEDEYGPMTFLIVLNREFSDQTAINPTIIEELSHYAIRGLKRYWHDEMLNGGDPSWAPLKPETIRRKIEAGDPLPDTPLLGHDQGVLDFIDNLDPELHITHRDDGDVQVDIDFGVPSNQDMSPSERWQDLFEGAPADFEEAAHFGQRGVIPARPLAINQETAKNALEHFWEGRAQHAMLFEEES